VGRTSIQWIKKCYIIILLYVRCCALKERKNQRGKEERERERERVKLHPFTVYGVTSPVSYSATTNESNLSQVIVQSLFKLN
jgi:hypothetical protein